MRLKCTLVFCGLAIGHPQCIDGSTNDIREKIFRQQKNCICVMDYFNRGEQADL